LILSELFTPDRSWVMGIKRTWSISALPMESGRVGKKYASLL
jgi:hypothetical protein